MIYSYNLVVQSDFGKLFVRKKLVCWGHSHIKYALRNLISLCDQKLNEDQCSVGHFQDQFKIKICKHIKRS